MSEGIRSGEVLIRLGETEVRLIPSAGALRTLCKEYGGLTQVITAIGQMSDAVMVDVIAAGAQATAEDRKRLPDDVFAVGLFELAPKLTRFVMILGNGGRDPDAEALKETAPQGEA